MSNLESRLLKVRTERETRESEFVQNAIMQFADKLLQAGLVTIEKLEHCEVYIAGIIDDAEANGWPNPYPALRAACGLRDLDEAA